MRWLCLAILAACSSDPAPPSSTVTSTGTDTDTDTVTDTDTDTDTVTETASSAVTEEPGTGTGTGTGTGELVDVATIAPSVPLDMRYATTRNFTNTAFYPAARCLLRRDAAARLARVQRRLEARGLSLLLWDCYRPFSVQKRLWALVPDPRYVAEPVEGPGGPLRGSKHNRGMAVDLTLADRDGRPLEMPTDHDDFSPRAHRGSRAASPAARRNAQILEDAMAAEGFEALPTEWWHFDAPGWKDAPLLDLPLR